MATPRVSFVIPVRNDATRLQRCLTSITSHVDGTPVEIIVADNGSTDASASVARAAGATVVDLPGRPVSHVRNLAARTARGEFIAFVDADHALAPGWTAEALARLEDANVWAVGAEYETPAGGSWVQRMYDRFREHRPGNVSVDWLPSGNLVVRRSAFERVRGFDENLESCEDVDFCRRIRECGGTLLSASALRSIHYGDPKTLANLFFSELWRGRDNIRVSLRERLTLRSAPSLAIPVLNLLALTLAVAGILLAPWRGWWWPVAGVTAFLGLTILRAVRLLFHIPSHDRRLTDVPQAWMVAATYDLARALALVLRASHNIRRKS